ncbi:MAG: sulfite dehydrogenase [Gemmatimonadota bacterium]|jgi:sulfane dehydrogenase subunit SoxC
MSDKSDLSRTSGEAGPPPEPRQGLSRRTWLAAASGAAAAGLVHTRFHAVDLLARQAAPGAGGTVQGADVRSAASRALGRLPSELGSRAPGERPRRLIYRPAASGGSLSPLQDLDGILTPADLHFERHHGGIPDLLAEDHELLVHGMVERPTVFRMPDLKRFPAASRICFLECSGNGNGVYRPDPPGELTPQRVDGLLSTSEWVGVPLSTLLREVGVKPGASWILAEGGDAALLARSIPLSKAMDDALVAYGQNGEALRPEQGYPARLLLPGFEGNSNVKWIRRIEVSDRPTMTREETSKYTDPLKDGTARQFSFVMDAKSIITFPAYPYALPERGWWEIRGLAWSGRGRIVRVDVSTDGGRSWAAAELQGPVLPTCTVRFRHLWRWNGREAFLLSRAVDESGYVQPTYAQLVEARGAGTTYHANHLRAWRVASDGQVTYGQGALT